MKNVVLLFLFSMLWLTSFAQELPRQLYADSVLGWTKVYHFKGVKEPLKVHDKTYLPAQLSISDSLANWMQASYIPKGGLGDVKKRLLQSGFSISNYSAALPTNYGANCLHLLLSKIQ
ncbi:MAG: hypothetical protein U5K54_29560 [Cytophagales bacterium]|nr:hypothetical protein [Cytophagales bacterium]